MLAHLDNLHRYMVSAFLSVSLIGIAMLSAREQMHAVDCLAYTPTKKCELSKYEVRVHRVVDCVEKTCGRTIAVAEGACVIEMNHGTWSTYYMPEAKFFRLGAAEPEYMDGGIELPAAQSQVCQVR